MKVKVLALALMAAAAAIFALTRTGNALPAEFRDAPVFRSFAAAAPSFEKAGGVIPASAPGKMPVKDWTVMYYINGKNNLDSTEGPKLWLLELVGSGTRVNIVVERGSIGKGGGETAYDKENWTGSRRYYITKKAPSDPAGTLTSEVLMKFPRVDMGDHRHAAEFVAWAKTNYPARHYMLVLDNHGSGLRDKEKKPGGKGVSFDDETGNYITNVEIGKILREAGAVDVLVFDACLMQSAEIAYELKGLADFVIGSEETSWGIAHSGFLSGLTAAPAINGEQAARLLLKSETEHWASWRALNVSHLRWSQLSILNLSEFDAFVVLLNRWTGLVEEAACVPAVRAALSGTMRFYMDSDNSRQELSLYGDLSGFIRIYTDSVPAGHPRAGELKAAGRELLDLLETRLIMNNIAFGNNEAGRSMTDAHGLSIYLPALRGDREAAEKYLGGKYTDLSFIKDSRWYEFVNYLWASMPPPSVNACKKPGPGASAQVLKDYMACIRQARPWREYRYYLEYMLDAVCKPPNASASYLEQQACRRRVLDKLRK